MKDFSGTIGADGGIGAGGVLGGTMSAIGGAGGACSMWPQASDDWAENRAVGPARVEIQSDYWYWCSASSSG